ncbi:MAG: tetratricopeptide repeat protein [Bacteroidales bacterium]
MKILKIHIYLALIFVFQVLYSTSTYSNNSGCNFQDTQEIQKILEKAKSFESTNADSAFYYYSILIPKDIFEQDIFNNWKKDSGQSEKYYTAIALTESGLIYLRKDDVFNGEQYLKKSLVIADIIEEFRLAVYASNNLAVFFAERKNYFKAIEYFEISLAYNKKLADTDGIIYCKGNLGALYGNMGNYYAAAHYYEKLLELQQKSNIPIETVNEIINIAMLYTKLNEAEKAIVYWEKSLEESIKRDETEFLSLIYSNLGSNYYDKEEYEKAYRNYLKYLEISKLAGNKNNEVLALNNIAIIEYTLGKYHECIESWEKVIELAKETGQGQMIFDGLLNLSNIYSQLGEVEKSLSYYNQYLDMGRQVNDPELIAKANLSIGEVLMQAQNYPESREYFKKAHEDYITMGNFSEAAKINNIIAGTYASENNMVKAIEFFNKNIDSAEMKDSMLIAESHQGLADLFRQNRQFGQAIKNYEIALSIYREKRQLNRAASCLNALASVQEVYGDLPKAIDLYEEALDFAVEMGNKEAEAAIYNNIGVVFRQLGDLLKAENSYLKATVIYEQLDNKDAIAYCYNNLGVIYEIAGDYETASDYYQKSFNIKFNTNDRKGLAASLLNMGNIYRFQGDFENALDYYYQSLDIYEELNDQHGIAVVLASLSALKIETGEFNVAIGLAEKSRAISEQYGYLNTLRESYRQLAWAQNKTDNEEKAEHYYLKVIEMNHDEITRNFSILSESEKEKFFETVAEDFERFNAFALERQKNNPEITGEVYDNLLRNKGLLLKSSTAMRNAVLSSGDEELVKSFNNWIRLKQEIAEQYTLSADERSDNIKQMEEEANDLERFLVRNSNEFSEFEQSLAVSWQQVKQNLKPNEAAIEFTHFKNSNDEILYCALILKPERDYPEMIPLFDEVLLEETTNRFSGNNYQYISQIYGERHSALSSLYELIWRPLEGYLHYADRIYLSPSGLLHKIAFSAISEDRDHFLIDDFEIYNLSTTANVGSDVTININNDINFSLFGGIDYTVDSDDESWSYLPGTLSEVNNIKSIVKPIIDNTTAKTGIKATEENFKELAVNSQILHIATHGFFFPDPATLQEIVTTEVKYEEVIFRAGSPGFGHRNFVSNSNPLMRSGLVFAGVNDYWSGKKEIKDDDGVLTALEVINIDMRRNQLVVMSACETGLGDIKGSEGVYGLQRAFKMAGTKHMIMSLWKVPDKETAEFMETFYKLLLEENDLYHAFLETQRKMRALYDPFYWAAFVLIK